VLFLMSERDMLLKAKEDIVYDDRFSSTSRESARLSEEKRFQVDAKIV